MAGPGQEAGARLLRIELRDMRPFTEAVLEPDPDGATLITGPNGSGKTTLLEAVGYLSTQRSFRTHARDAMVRAGADRAIVRAELRREDRPVLVECEIPVTGTGRVLLNRQLVRSRRDSARAVPVTIFSPEDLAIVQGPPANRRDLLDDALRLLDATAASELDELERVLRQRSALLRQAAGRLGPDIASSLDVWDERLAARGEAVVQARRALLHAVGSLVDAAYSGLAGPGHMAITLAYRPSWTGPLAAALSASRMDDVRRASSTIGPHRDDVELRIDARDARVQASQGEQRSLALALRLGVHRLVTERSSAPPILLLDDVFSELDPERSQALIRRLPAGQALVTTAAPLPDGVPVAKLVDVRRVGARR